MALAFSSVSGDTVTVTLDDTSVSAGSYGSGTSVPVLTVALPLLRLRPFLPPLTSLPTPVLTAWILVPTPLPSLVAPAPPVSGDTVTVTLDDTAVTAAAYGNATSVATFTVDARALDQLAPCRSLSRTRRSATSMRLRTLLLVRSYNGTHSGVSATYDDANDGAIDISLTNTGVGAATTAALPPLLRLLSTPRAVSLALLTSTSPSLRALLPTFPRTQLPLLPVPLTRLRFRLLPALSLLAFPATLPSATTLRLPVT